jgi:hypothetical protein
LQRCSIAWLTHCNKALIRINTGQLPAKLGRFRTQSGSPDALLRRGPLRTVHATRRGTAQASHWGDFRSAEVLVPAAAAGPASSPPPMSWNAPRPCPRCPRLCRTCAPATIRNCCTPRTSPVTACLRRRPAAESVSASPTAHEHPAAGPQPRRLRRPPLIQRHLASRRSTLFLVLLAHAALPRFFAPGGDDGPEWDEARVKHDAGEDPWA